MQSKLHSWLEALTSTAAGFMISVLTQICVINPLFDLDLKPSESFTIVGIYTVISVIRGYVIRRYFNRKIKHVAS